MKTDHPNIDLIGRIDTSDITANADMFHPDVVWHFFNSKAPELAGSYNGVSGIAAFFEKVHSYGEGSFAIRPQGAWAVGDELVVVQTCNLLGEGTTAMAFDVVVIWRIVDGKIAEIWDIPAINTLRSG